MAVVQMSGVCFADNQERPLVNSDEDNTHRDSDVDKLA